MHIMCKANLIDRSFTLDVKFKTLFSSRNKSELFARANAVAFCRFPLVTIVWFIARSFVFRGM